MYDPQGDEATREAEAVGATELAPTVTTEPSNAGTGVVDAFAWSQEDRSAGAEPVPYLDPYEQAAGTGRRPAVAPPAPIPGRRHPSGLPRLALWFGILVTLIAVAGALYSLLRASQNETPVQPETSAVVVPPPSGAAPSPSAPPPPPTPVAPPPPAAATTTVPPEPTTAAPTTTTAAPTTTTAPPATTTTTAPPATTTTTAPTTTAPTTTVPTTTVPTTTAPPVTTAPVTTAPPSTTVPMTTEYLRIPLLPIPIPITVPEN